jgi:hypothetical protein
MNVFALLLGIVLAGIAARVRHMKHACLILVALLLAPQAAYSEDNPRPALLDQQWVAPGENGKLEYKTTPRGDRIIDFSHAGYMGGGVSFPAVPVKREVAPSGGDDSAAIQAAIEEVSSLTCDKGLRGAVLLKPGTFLCSQPITIGKDGVVLRGSGPGKDGSLIQMTGEPHTALIIEGPDASYPKVASANTFPIADAYIPAGALSLTVNEANGLAAGDAIRIRWARTAKWIEFMGMDKLVRKRKGQPDVPQTWMKEDSEMTIHRTIRSIEGNRITLDVPFTDTIDAELLGSESAVVVKTPAVKHLSQCGIESLQIVSPAHKGDLTAGKNVSVVLTGGCEDCWVQDIVMRETLNNVQVGGGCRRITITEAHSYHNSTVEKGAGYPADISIRGSQVLVDRCTSHGLGGFYVATLNPGAMLNVVLNCTFEGAGSIQPHMRWSTGLLIDSCNIPDGRIDLINRHSSGSGHGWAIGWGIAWNCEAKYLQVQMPPGALNLAIGCKGEPHKTFSKESFYSADTPVAPASLYLAQLRERLGETAVKNIGY